MFAFGGRIHLIELRMVDKGPGVLRYSPIMGYCSGIYGFMFPFRFVQ